jgi:hypothetical protein
MLRSYKALTIVCGCSSEAALSGKSRVSNGELVS